MSEVIDVDCLFADICDMECRGCADRAPCGDNEEPRDWKTEISLFRKEWEEYLSDRGCL